MRRMSARLRHDPTKTMVGFMVGDVQYAVPIGQVREISNPLSIVELPRAPASVIGVADYRGEVVPVVDLRSRFGLASAPASRRTKWLVVDVGQRFVALVVDAATEVFGTGGTDVQAAPSLGGGEDARGNRRGDELRQRSGLRARRGEVPRADRAAGGAGGAEAEPSAEPVDAARTAGAGGRDERSVFAGFLDLRRDRDRARLAGAGDAAARGATHRRAHRAGGAAAAGARAGRRRLAGAQGSGAGGGAAGPARIGGGDAWWARWPRPGPSVLRNAAVEALVGIGSEGGAAGWWSRASGSTPTDASSPPRVLAGIPDERSVDQLVILLKDEDPNVRATAAEGLAVAALAGETARTAATRALVSAAHEGELFVRLAALEGLTRARGGARVGGAETRCLPTPSPGDTRWRSRRGATNRRRSRRWPAPSVIASPTLASEAAEALARRLEEEDGVLLAGVAAGGRGAGGRRRRARASAVGGDVGLVASAYPQRRAGLSSAWSAIRSTWPPCRWPWPTRSCSSARSSGCVSSGSRRSSP